MKAEKHFKMGNLGINVEHVEHVEDNEDNYGDYSFISFQIMNQSHSLTLLEWFDIKS